MKTLNAQHENADFSIENSLDFPVNLKYCEIYNAYNNNAAKKLHAGCTVVYYFHCNYVRLSKALMQTKITVKDCLTASLASTLSVRSRYLNRWFVKFNVIVHATLTRQNNWVWWNSYMNHRCVIMIGRKTHHYSKSNEKRCKNSSKYGSIYQLWLNWRFWCSSWKKSDNTSICLHILT